MGQSKSGTANVDTTIAENDVVVFSASYCPYCRKAQEALKEAKIDYTLVEVDSSIKQALVAKTGKTSVPQVFVKQQFVGGCNDGGMGGTLPLLKSGKIQSMLAA